MIRYNKRRWLNSEDSPSTGNIVCFDGDTTWNGNSARNIFISISDCHNSARLHMTEDDSIEDFIKKAQVLRDELTNFINHLIDDNSTDCPTNDVKMWYNRIFQECE